MLLFYYVFGGINMSVFKLLIGVVVVVVLLYFILTLFVLPKPDILTPIANSTKVALLKAGEPVCGIVNLPKDFSLTSTQLQNNNIMKDLNIFFWLTSFNANSKTSSLPNEVFVLKTDSAMAQENYCVTCYPGSIFYDVPEINTLQGKDYFCQVSFGKKLLPVSAELPILQDYLQQGDLKLQNPFYKNSLNSEVYDYYFFIIPTQPKTNFNLSDLSGLGNNIEIEHMKKFSSTEINEKELLNISLPNAGPKLIVQGIVGKNKTPFSLEPMLPALFSVNFVEILPNKEYQSENCIATTSEKQYKNFEKNLCVVYNKCNNCSLPTYCAEAWQKKGTDAESKTKDYATSYLPIDECS